MLAAMAAASADEHWVPSPAAVFAVTAAAPRGGTSEGALLTQFTAYERLEASVLVPADECTLGEVRNAALRDELQGHCGLPRAPGSAPN